MYRGLSLHALAVAGLVAFSGCGEEARTVRLVRLTPQASPECGAPIDARTLRVAAIGDFSTTDDTTEFAEIGIGDPLNTDRFPPETQALEVEVLGLGGALRTIGRSELFDAEALEDGGEIGVFMAPLNGTCPTGPPNFARSGALAAVTGDDVVIVGGVDANGDAVSRPEIYRSREARFVEIPQELYGTVEEGLVGAALTPLSDGRIALIGGGQNAYQVFTPEEGQFREPPLLLRQARAFHATVALDADRVFMAGGCTMVEDGQCADGSETPATAILHLETGEIDTGPPLTFLRVGARAFLEPDGRVIVVGGSFGGAPVLSAERIDPQGRQEPETLLGAGQVGVRLASGAIVTAYGPEEAASGDGAAYAPGGTAGAALVPAPSRTAPTLTALESGRVIAFGGAGGGAGANTEAALFSPLSGRWIELDGIGLATRRRHASARLPDGSVLIVGGESATGEHLGDAVIFRPDLLGPLTGELSINFADESAEQLVPRDRAAIAIIPAGGGVPAHLEITARATDEGVPGEWAVVAPPLLGSSTIEMTISGQEGFAILTGFEEPTTFRSTLVLPGIPVTVVDIQAGSVRNVSECVGQAAAPTDLADGQRWTHETREDRLVLTGPSGVLLDCETSFARIGRIGIGALGPTGSTTQLFQLTVQR